MYTGLFPVFARASMIYHLIMIVTQAEEDSDPDVADESCITLHRVKRSLGGGGVVSRAKSGRIDA